ncbi:hypothetical protein PVAP13_9KG401929 [Panicum virgatum]|uniref:Uncharacterized protein n=1 Tax=Panicum virgatum TaxID=38727 RepID=A0A8T0N7S7_PANVG|nr:hypothetical protein PVAP13_9KG401929 [Panicum virgatum]
MDKLLAGCKRFPVHVGSVIMPIFLPQKKSINVRKSCAIKCKALTVPNSVVNSTSQDPKEKRHEGPIAAPPRHPARRRRLPSINRRHHQDHTPALLPPRHPEREGPERRPRRPRRQPHAQARRPGALRLPLRHRRRAHRGPPAGVQGGRERAGPVHRVREGPAVARPRHGLRAHRGPLQRQRLRRLLAQHRRQAPGREGARHRRRPRQVPDGPGLRLAPDALLGHQQWRRHRRIQRHPLSPLNCLHI